MMADPNGGLAHKGAPEDDEFDLSSLGEPEANEKKPADKPEEFEVHLGDFDVPEGRAVEVPEGNEETGFELKGRDEKNLKKASPTVHGEQPKPSTDYNKKTDELLAKESVVPGKSAEEWISEVEADKRVGLSKEVRGLVAKALITSDKPTVALKALRDEFLEENPNSNKRIAEVIDGVIDRVEQNSGEAAALKTIESKTPMEFYARISRSVQNTLDAAESLGAENLEEVETAADRLTEIFETLRDEVESGFVTSDMDELQKEIDGYVENLKFDKSVFDGAVKKYLRLSGINIKKVEFTDFVSDKPKEQSEE